MGVGLPELEGLFSRFGARMVLVYLEEHYPDVVASWQVGSRVRAKARTPVAPVKTSTPTVKTSHTMKVQRAPARRPGMQALRAKLKAAGIPWRRAERLAQQAAESTDTPDGTGDHTPTGDWPRTEA